MAHLARRKNKDGTTSWVAQVRVNGYPSQTRSFRTRLEAELWSSQTEARAHKRTLALVRKITLGELIDEVAPRLKQLRAAPLRYWKEHLGGVYIHKIDATLITHHRDLLLGAPCGGWLHAQEAEATQREHCLAVHPVFIPCLLHSETRAAYR